MDYQVFLEDQTLDAYTMDHTPSDDLSKTLVCWWANVTDGRGTHYNVMRGLPLPSGSLSMNFGAFQGNGELDAACEPLFSFKEHPAVEPFTQTRSPDTVAFSGRSFELEQRVDSHDWLEAGGRIRLHAELLGSACTFSVPEQDGIAHPLQSRSTMGKVAGTLDGEAVEGLYFCDHIYTRPGLNFRESRFSRDLHNFWMNWLVEYEDGSLEGGFTWRGMPGTGFAAAHHYVDGKSHARADGRIEVERSDSRGTMSRWTVGLGDDVEIVLDQHGSYDWPLHTYGTITSNNRDKAVARSWNYSENFPLNWGAVEDYQLAHAHLFGRYPSLAGILEEARIEDGAIVFG